MPKPTIDLDANDPELSDAFLYHSPIYLDPHTIADAENVRPGESPAEHEARVNVLAEQIKADGQSTPIKVRETEAEGGYQVVAGQGRIDALRLLNNRIKSSGEGEPLLAWCVLDSNLDSWASAVKENVQRKNYSDVQIADLIAQARTRYKWDTKGGEKKLAAFFGILPTHLVEYNTLASAPAHIKERVQTGELSKSGALRLIKVTESTPAEAMPAKQKAIVAKAKEIAKAEKPAPKAKPAPTPVSSKKAKQADDSKKAKQDAPKEQTAEPVKEKPAKVQAKHIAQAAREVAIAANEPVPVVKRNRTEILATISNLLEFSPDIPKTEAARAFLLGIQKFADGEFSPRQLQNRWNLVIGVAPKK